MKVQSKQIIVEYRAEKSKKCKKSKSLRLLSHQATGISTLGEAAFWVKWNQPSSLFPSS